MEKEELKNQQFNLLKEIDSEKANVLMSIKKLRIEIEELRCNCLQKLSLIKELEKYNK